jgi:hypothetical protein
MEVERLFSGGAWFALGIVFALGRAAFILAIILASSSLVMGSSSVARRGAGSHGDIEAGSVRLRGPRSDACAV